MPISHVDLDPDLITKLSRGAGAAPPLQPRDICLRQTGHAVSLLDLPILWCVISGEGEQSRESELYGERLDPIASAVLGEADAWAAYRLANTVKGQLVDDLEWLPHGGHVFVAWAELTDLYETGKTAISEAHAVLRHAASTWLDRPGLPDADHIERWAAHTSEAVHTRFRRDGDFWHAPS